MASASTGKIHILVIDDDPLNQVVVSRGLEKRGYHVESAYDGAEGIRMALANPPDLIVCDISMPEADGYAVIQRMQTHDRLAGVPFIFLTAFSDYDDLRKGMTLGADDYITKPFTIKDLIAAVETRLARHKRITQPIEDEMEALRSNIAMLLPHELRTPLMLIEGYTSLLRDDFEQLAPNVQGLIEPIINSTRRLHRQIENCLAYTDQAILKDQASKSTIPAALTIEQVARAAAAVHQREDSLMFHLVGGAIYFPKRALEKIVTELVDNACKFSSPDQPIHLVSTQQDRLYALAITDKGRGMTQAQIEKVGAYMQFERQRYEQQGIGMGLVVAKQLAERHGALFSIESELGIYTSVSILFPSATGTSDYDTRPTDASV